MENLKAARKVIWVQAEQVGVCGSVTPMAVAHRSEPNVVHIQRIAPIYPNRKSNSEQSFTKLVQYQPLRPI
jgi:hypothetical protein